MLEFLKNPEGEEDENRALAAYGGETGFDMLPDVMAVDEIFAHNNNRIEQCMDDVKEVCMKDATDMFYNQVVNLGTMVHKLEQAKEKDLQWLLQKTILYDNPLKEETDELKNICIAYGINNPIIGEE